MTNNWTDIGNSTLVVVMGANPAENHPACIAHVNTARRGPHSWTDRAGNTHNTAKPAAKLVVIDPRRNRTALMADLFVRIRPGTDIAFINALIRYIISTMEAKSPTDPVRLLFDTYLTETAVRPFMNDAGVVQNVTHPRNNDALFRVASSGTDYVRSTTGPISNFPQRKDGIAQLRDADTVYSALKTHVAPYTFATVADICGCTEGEIKQVADLYIEHARCSSRNAAGLVVSDPKSANFRSTTMLYAMGLTQHTHGSQNVRAFATLQVLLGNIGRAGSGINALRGIHNVQGSTDHGLLQHLIPGYSGNPVEPRSADPNAFGRYTDRLWGRRISGNGYANAYKQGHATAIDRPELQQVGFTNMTRKWFGGTITEVPYEDAGATAKGAAAERIDNLYDLWPKTAGDLHTVMFRKMALPESDPNRIKATVVWAQNPAVTQPNQSKVREGLKNLDLLVCVDLFETETASCDRKSTGVTYLIPAASYAECAGSSTNSGRVLQWRYAARTPAGNSRPDTELLLRFAYALDNPDPSVDAFSHIKTVWARPAVGITGSGLRPVYKKLYGDQYGWTPGEVFDAEAVAEKGYEQMFTDTRGTDGGTLWICTLGWQPTLGATQSSIPWTKTNRSKERNGSDMADSSPSGRGNRLFTNWGYSWLVNRRVLYNQAGTAAMAVERDVPGDQTDGYQTPDKIGRLFVPVSYAAPTAPIDYAHLNYRFIHTLADKPDVSYSLGSIHKFPGRLPSHTEPYETPHDGTVAGKSNLTATWGRNTKGGGALDLVLEGTPIAGLGRPGDPATTLYPLVLTTIRCVEHFQGGPITRNNWWNVEAEPQPWIEINSTDALEAGIKNGDMVKIITARTDTFADDEIESEYPRALYGDGFIARVGTGLPKDQRVGRGVVAIPWHWGDRGLSAGSRANDLTVDAGDPNTYIPEYKACLCRLVKM